MKHHKGWLTQARDPVGLLFEHAAPIFEPGNIVISGLVGSSRSLLLKSMSSEDRVERWAAGAPLPIPKHCDRFISASINVVEARCLDFGNRSALKDLDRQKLIFGDFINFQFARSLFRSLDLLSSNSGLAAYIGLRFDDLAKEAFAGALLDDHGWRSCFPDAQNYAALKRSVNRRIDHYRRYLTGEDDRLNEAVTGCLTFPGEPLAQVSQVLDSQEIIPSDVPVLLTLDGYQHLSIISDPDGIQINYCSIVNRMVNRRERSPSYRISAHGQHWRSHNGIFGTDARLEQDRDFRLVDIDENIPAEHILSINLGAPHGTQTITRHPDLADAAYGDLERVALDAVKAIAAVSPEPDSEIEPFGEIGHNQPPPEAALTEADYAETVSALQDIASGASELNLTRERLEKARLVLSKSIRKIGTFLAQKYKLMDEGFFRGLGTLGSATLIAAICSNWAAVCAKIQDVLLALAHLCTLFKG